MADTWPCGGIKPPDAIHGIDNRGRPLCGFTDRPIWPKGQTCDFGTDGITCPGCRKVLTERSAVCEPSPYENTKS